MACGSTPRRLRQGLFALCRRHLCGEEVQECARRRWQPVVRALTASERRASFFTLPLATVYVPHRAPRQ